VILESKSIYTGILRHSMVEKGRNDDMEKADMEEVKKAENVAM
jgi:hypothetical protein